MTEFQKIVKGFAIAFAIFLTISIFGGIFSALGFGLGGINQLGNQDDVNAGKHEEQTNFYDAEQVKSIKLEQVACNIEIVEGDEFSVFSQNVKGYKEKLNSNGALKIENDSLPFFSFGNAANGKTAKIVITVPKATDLNKITIDGGAGNIKLESITVDKLEISAGAGNVNLNDVKSSELELDGGAGNMEGENITADKVEIDAGVGNLEFSSVDFSRVDLDCGMGNIKIAGVIKGDNKIDCGVGEVNLNLEDSLDEYDFSVDTGVGNIVIDGKKYGEVNHTNSAANHSFDIDGGVGNCTITGKSE